MSVPVPFSTLPLKRLISSIASGVSVNATDSPAGKGNLGVLKTSCVYTGVFDSSENKTVVPEDIDRVACPVRAGTLIVSRMNTPDLVGAAGLATVDEPDIYLPDRLWQVSFHQSIANPRYVYWWTRSALYRDQVKVACAGTSSSMQNLDQDSFRSFVVPSLSVAEQLRIAKFLDEKTTRIDALIAEKERLVETIEEFQRSSLWEILTKGFEPLAGKRESGVEWIGQVPSHWTVKRLKWLTPVLRGASPRPIDDPKYFDEEGEYAWVRIADVSASDGYLLTTQQQLSSLGASLSVKREPGDLFLSIAGTVGKPCIAKIKCCIHDGFVWFPGLQDDLLRDWLFNIFEAGVAYAGLGKMGTQLNLNTDTVGSIQIPLPPKDEMGAILEKIGEVKLANSSLRHHVMEHLTRLREYRSSLISAAVTGELDLGSDSAVKTKAGR